jgi:hypothetical protein
VWRGGAAGRPLAAAPLSNGGGKDAAATLLDALADPLRRTGRLRGLRRLLDAAEGVGGPVQAGR